ncbi:MAG: hypothetical protein U0401_05735 [Anaerolineae bacterium]
MVKGYLHILWRLVFLTLLFTACSGNATPLPQTQIENRVWQALEPNTSSHQQANWEVVESRAVSGGEVSERFAGKPDPGCVPGPTPSPNQSISPTATYWYVHMRPRPATPLPDKFYSPTAPPNIPEATVRQAEFLVDPNTGKIVARKFQCVIY